MTPQEFMNRIVAWVLAGDPATDDVVLRFRRLTARFDASVPTVGRWFTGENLPHEVMWPAIVEFLDGNP